MQKRIISMAFAVVLMLSMMTVGYASPIDFDTEGTGVTTEQSTAKVPDKTKETTAKKTEATVATEKEKSEGSSMLDTDAVKDNVKNLASVMGGVSLDEESATKVNKTMEPIAKIVQRIIGYGLAIISFALLIYTVADLAYINIPITRSILENNRLVSDEAKLVITPEEIEDMHSRRGGMGMGMGMGGGMYDEYDPAPRAGGDKRGKTKKTTNGQYFSLRSRALIAFGLCSVLCVSTLFTRLGLLLATWLLNLFTFFV